SGPSAGLNVESFTLTASGHGNDVLDGMLVKVYLDANGNGRFDTGETMLGNGQYTADNGTWTSTFAPGRIIPVGQSETWLVTYDFSATLASGVGGGFTQHPGNTRAEETAAGRGNPVALALLFAILLGFAGIRRYRGIGLTLLLLVSLLWFAACGGGGSAPAQVRAFKAALSAIGGKGASSGVDANISGALPIDGPSVTVQK
ncbi:MAG: hypothetical protein ACREJQ_07605, partial [bacterium]